MEHDNYTPPPEGMQIIRNLRNLVDGLYVVYGSHGLLEKYSHCVILRRHGNSWFSIFPMEVDVTEFQSKFKGVIGPLPDNI